MSGQPAGEETSVAAHRDLADPQHAPQGQRLDPEQRRDGLEHPGEGATEPGAVAAMTVRGGDRQRSEASGESAGTTPPSTPPATSAARSRGEEPRVARPRRQRLDAEARRTSILDAGARLFAGASYAAVSTQQIAAASGASQALVFHYFGSKAGLYTACVEASVAALLAAQQAADAALPAGVPARDRVRASIVVYLDHVASQPEAWATSQRGGEEPAEATAVRREARAHYVELLTELLDVRWLRGEYAVHGYFGFLDAACLAWVDRGCPDAERDSLTDAALGALEGALGDWGR